MAVAIEVSFFSATQKLTDEDRGRVLTFVNKFLENPAQPSLSLERVQQARSDNVWSARVSRELRAILFRDGEDCVLVYVDHHDDAYQWAAGRSIARHDRTGALQIIALPTVNATAVSVPQQGVFANCADEYLHSLGVPQVWLPTLRQVGSEDELIEVLQKLPQDVAERLCDVAAGRLVTPPAPISTLSAAAEHADQGRNLFVVRSRDDLRPLLDAPMATWIAFLHPTQRKLACSTFNGAVKVTGSAGTGKTVVAMHRARHLAQQGQRVLLTSYVNTLCHNLRRNLQLFCTRDELQRITVATLHTTAHNLLKDAGEVWQPVEDQRIIEWLQPLLTAHPCSLDAESVLVEWRDVIQAQAINSWEGYRSASRTGRGRPLTVKDRKVIWEIIEQLQHLMLKRRETDFSGLCRQALALLVTGRIRSPFDAVIVDEMQDLGASELRLLAALAGQGADRLMLVGDGGQRIYAAKYSLKSLGIDVRGRAHVLRLNYRTTEQIRRFADRILGDEADDLEGGRESRRGTMSMLSGPEPIRRSFPTRSEQCNYVAAQIGHLLQGGRTPDDIAVFARQANLLDMIETRLKRAGVPWHRFRNSVTYSLTGVGKFNTFALFAELNNRLMSPAGRVGCIVPSGIATDDTTKLFFQHVVTSNSLVSLFDFENRDAIFPGVHRSYKFCLLTLTGKGRPVKQGTEFVFFAHSVEALRDEPRRFTLSSSDIALLNPNTLTCATFRSRRDAAITKAIYQRVPVFPNESKSQQNAYHPQVWRLLNTTDDSEDFVGFSWKRRDELVPVIEAKTIHQFDHRFATFTTGSDDAVELTAEAKASSSLESLARYYVTDRLFLGRMPEPLRAKRWFLTVRNIARSTDERTVIAAIIPRGASCEVTPYIETIGGANVAAFLVGLLNSFVLDYVARQKVGGTHLSYFILYQLPILFPPTDHPLGLQFVAPHVLELTYTAYDLEPFATDCGYSGPPFRWDEERRFLLRCELDAAYFHLYGIGRDDVDYILETFPIVKRKDEQVHSEYRTKRVILAIYDAMQQAIETGTPYHTRLDPPPANGWTPPEITLEAVAGPQGDGAKEDTGASSPVDFQRCAEPIVSQPRLNFDIMA